MTGKKIFLTYDFCHDSGLYRQFLLKLEHEKEDVIVAAHSMDYCHSHSEIISSLHSAIARVDGLLVLVGKHTHRAGNVLQEVTIAQELDRPVAQIGGFSNTWCAGLSEHITYFDWRAISMKQAFASRQWHGEGGMAKCSDGPWQNTGYGR